MTKTLTLTDQTDRTDQPVRFDGLAARVVAYDAGFRSAYGQQMGYAFLAGTALNRAKAMLPHGAFGEWVDANLSEIGHSSVQRYMKFAGEVSNYPLVGNLDTEKLLLTDGALRADEEKKVLKAVHDLADGRSLTEFYRDLGVIKKPLPPGFRPNAKAVQAWLKEHHPELAGTKYQDLAPEIQKAFKKQYKPEIDPHLLATQRRDEWFDVIKRVEALLDDKRARTVLSMPEDKEFLSRACGALLDARKLLKGIRRISPAAAAKTKADKPEKTTRPEKTLKAGKRESEARV